MHQTREEANCVLLLMHHTNFDTLYYNFHLVKIIFKFLKSHSLSHVLLRSVLFNFQIFGDFKAIFLLLISGLIPLCSKYRYYMISILLILLRYVLWHRMCSTLMNVTMNLRMFVLLLLDEVEYK
jgi:hypothetical protein